LKHTQTSNKENKPVIKTNQIWTKVGQFIKLSYIKQAQGHLKVKVKVSKCHWKQFWSQYKPIQSI